MFLTVGFSLTNMYIVLQGRFLIRYKHSGKQQFCLFHTLKLNGETVSFRADIKQYIGPPSVNAIYTIYLSCIRELIEVRIFNLLYLNCLVNFISFKPYSNSSKVTDNKATQCCDVRGRYLSHLNVLTALKLVWFETKVNFRFNLSIVSFDILIFFFLFDRTM